MSSAALPVRERLRAFPRIAPLALHRVGLTTVLALSAVLNVHRLAQNGYANIYYSAAVKSMLVSLHNFLFVSFDPGGLMTVDKPPLGLWVQVASAKLFGLSPLSLLLPEAIAGVLAVGALYWTMAKPFGRPAALAGALVLAVFPSFVAVSRDNNLDAILILLMILAGGLALRAVQDGRWRTLLGCAVLVGLAFNTKTLAAYLIVPGIFAAYAVGAPGPLHCRLSRLLVAGALAVAISFAWIAFVELTPASQRPYIGGSFDNTELGLTFEYNGLGRVGGQVGGPGRVPGATIHPAISTRPAPSPTLPNGRLRHPVAFGGATGPLRLFDTALGDQGGWMLPFALLGLVALALSLVPIRRRDPRLAGLLVLGGWFLVEAAVLSFSKGIVHPYYVSALGPGAAAMAGAGAAALVALGRRSDRRVAYLALALLSLAVAVTVAVQWVLLDRAHYMHWLLPPLAVAATLGVGMFVVLRRGAPLAMAFTLGALLLAPGGYAASTWEAPVQGTFPAAGPRQATGYGGLDVSPPSQRTASKLLRYVASHQPGTRWAVLTEASDTAAPLILLGLKAAAVAGYSATDPALDSAGLARIVARGEARYVVLGGAYSSRGGNRASNAAGDACLKVPPQTWQQRHLTRYGLVLFDCAGRQGRLATF